VELDQDRGSDLGAPLFGRERELTQLLEAFDRALGGRGRLVLLAGEPGIGKSRLADAFSEIARSRGAAVAWGRCWEAGGAPAYWPWTQALRSCLREQGPEELRRQLGEGAPHVAQMVPDLQRVLPEIPTPPGLDPDAARFRVFDAVTSFLRNAAASRPLVVVVDDLHVADRPSLLFLEFLAAELGTASIVVVGAYRDTELHGDHPLVPTLAQVARHPTTVRLELRGLREPEVAALTEAIAGETPDPPVAAAIHDETEGNPLFATEMVRLLAAEGLLAGEGGLEKLRGAIPQSLREVIHRRLGRLSTRCVDLLALASILGREFDLSALARLDGRPIEEVVERLEEAEAATVVIDVPGSIGRLRFSHALVRDALYDEIPRARRLRLHRRAGEALAARYAADPEPHLAELAHHFLQAVPAGDVDSAVAYARRAGERAVRLLAYEEGARLYEMGLRALDLVPSADPAILCDLLIALGDALARAGEAARAKDTFLRAADVARRGEMPEALARAALGYGGRFVWEAFRGDSHLVPLLEEALRGLPESYRLLRARLLARLAGGPLRDEPDPARRDALSREAVEIARELDDPPTLAWVLDGRHATIWGAASIKERLTIAEELVQVARRIGDKEREFQGHHYKFVAMLERGDPAGTKAELDAQARLADELRQPAQGAYVSCCRGTMAALEGRFEEAEELTRRTFEVARRAYGSMADVWVRIQRFAIARGRGRLEEVLELLAGSVVDFPSYTVFRYALAHGYAATERAPEARALLEELASTDFLVTPLEERIYGLGLLAEVIRTVGDARQAERLYDLLLPHEQEVAVSPPDDCVGSVARPLGMLAAVASRLDDAERHLVASIGVNERMGAEPWAASSRYELACVLADRARTGDRERAVELAHESLAAARKLGMDALGERVAELLDRLGETSEALRVVRSFLFTDIVGSTELIEAIGDEAWHDLRRWHDETLRACFAEHGGEEVDHAGDGFFVAFSSPAHAVACAIDIQRRLAKHRRAHGFSPRVRIAMHRAEATRAGAVYTGRGVHAAARLAALADGDEILASGPMLEALHDIRTSEPREVALKGLVDRLEVRSVEWR
jgi:class 3 adenylate cyclase